MYRAIDLSSRSQAIEVGPWSSRIVIRLSFLALLATVNAVQPPIWLPWEPSDMSELKLGSSLELSLV